MRSWLYATALPATLFLTACGGSDDTMPVVNASQAVTISFAAQANGKDVKCGAVNSIDNLGTSNKTAEIQDLRFYINDKGQAVAVTLDKNDYQNYGVALLDFEDATGACSAGTAQTYTAITGKINTGNYKGIQFVLGVPDTGLDSTGKTVALSHTETTSMSAPLDIAAMAWSWQGGRKFVKIEVNPIGGVTNQKKYA